MKNEYCPLPSIVTPGYSINNHDIVGVIHHDCSSIYYLTTDSQILQEFHPHAKGLNDVVSINIVRSNSMDLEVESGSTEYIQRRDRFVRGANIWKNFTQSVFLRVLDVFELHNTAYAVREYIPGRPLGGANKLTVDQFTKLKETLLSGLEIIHKTGYSPKGFLHQKYGLERRSNCWIFLP